MRLGAYTDRNAYIVIGRREQRNEDVEQDDSGRNVPPDCKNGVRTTGSRGYRHNDSHVVERKSSWSVIVL